MVRHVSPYPVWASVSRPTRPSIIAEITRRFRGRTWNCHCPSLIPVPPPPPRWENSLIHVFVWRQGTVGAFNLPSPRCPWLCSELALPSTSSPHHCVPRHRDDMQHVPWLQERGRVIIYSFTRLPPLLSPGFLISPSLVFCQLMMHNIRVLFEHVEAGCSVWGEHLTDRDMSALFPRICDRLILRGL